MKLFFKSILKGILAGSIVGSFFGLINYQYQINKETDIILTSLYNQAQLSTDNQNKLLHNDIRILADLQELERNSNSNIIKINEKIKEPNVDKLLKSSVEVRDLTTIGSGTVIKQTEDAMYILTCHHVISETLELEKTIGKDIGIVIRYFVNDEVEDSALQGSVLYKAKIIKYNEENDLALLKIFFVDSNLNALNVAEVEPKKGDLIYSIGNPLGYIRTVSKGILANKKSFYYITDNTTTFGNSGGGIFNVNEELIGVPSRVYVYDGFVPESGLGMSINLPTIKKFLQDIKW